MKIHNRILTGLLSAGLCLTLAVPALAVSTFSDVPEDHWAFEEIEEAVGEGITTGYADGTFKPANSVSYAHFSAFIARAFFPSGIENYKEHNPGASWQDSSVYTLEANNIYPGTKMADAAQQTGSYVSVLNTPITRYDMAQIMYNVLKLNVTSMPDGKTSGIGDWASIPDDYRDAVSVCYALGVLNGQSDGNFGGNNYMNRAQGCVVISRLENYIENGPASSPETPVDEEPVQEPEAPAQTGETLANGMPVTEENVLAMLEELREEYPQGMSWTDKNVYFSPNFHLNGSGCAAYAFTISDKIFGNLPVRTHQNYNEIRPGDVIHYLDENGNNVHWGVVTTAPDSEGWYKATGAGSSADSSVVWDQWASPEYLDNEVVYTRYPD